MKFAVNLMLLMWCMKNINCKESPNKNVTQTHLLINLLNDVEDAVHTAKQVAMSEIRYNLFIFLLLFHFMTFHNASFYKKNFIKKKHFGVLTISKVLFLEKYYKSFK